MTIYLPEKNIPYLLRVVTIIDSNEDDVCLDHDSIKEHS